jgi:Tfp pilus assembly protein PilX
MKQLVSRGRRGAALIAALVCLVIVMALLAAMLVGALQISRQMRVERDRRQCELLLQAGLDRAALRVSAAEPYQGEVWTVPAADIIQRGGGRVTIEVSRDGNAPPQIHVVSEYPVGSDSSIRRSRKVQLKPTTPLPQE